MEPDHHPWFYANANASTAPALRKEKSKESQSGFASWVASIFDVKCCAMREKPSDYDPRILCTGRPIKEFIDSARLQFPDSARLHQRPPPSNDMIRLPSPGTMDAVPYPSSTRLYPRPATNKDCISPHKGNPEVDYQPLHSSRHVRRDLIDKLAVLVDDSPYMAREIEERASRSLRYQFLRQCILRNYEKCEHIWGNLDEQERLDFMQMSHLGARNPDCFFLNVTEPDGGTLRQDRTPYSSTSSESEIIM